MDFVTKFVATQVLPPDPNSRYVPVHLKKLWNSIVSGLDMHGCIS